MEPCTSITAAKVIEGYRLDLTFSDGMRGTVDLRNRIVGRGGIFAPLEDADYFRKVRVDRELGTIVWPNGADFCPELLRDWASGGPVPLPEQMPVST